MVGTKIRGTTGGILGSLATVVMVSAATAASPASPVPGPSGGGCLPDAAPGTWRAWFSADDGVHGRELWATDGTPAGTLLFRDIDPSGSSDPTLLGTVAGTLYFSADDGVHGRELWATDGTSDGTSRLTDSGLDLRPAAAQVLAGMDGTTYLTAGRRSAGTELWATDGTVAGTLLLVTLHPSDWHDGPTEVGRLGGRLLFRVGGALWTTDGTIAGTRQLATEGGTGSISEAHGVIGGRLVYLGRSAADELVSGLWATDGTTAGTYLAAVDGENAWFAMAGDRMYFPADDGVHGTEVWVTDGTMAGTDLTLDIDPAGSSEAAPLLASGALLYLTADDGVHGREPWVTDGTASGTHLLIDANAQGDGDPSSLGETRGLVYLVARDGTRVRGLWATDGTTRGTHRIRLAGEAPYQLVAADRLTYILTSGGDRDRLWRTDGTDAGTVPLGAAGRSQGWANPMPLGRTLIVLAWEGGDGTSWITASRGTPRTTRHLARLRIPQYSYPAIAGTVGGRLLIVTAERPGGGSSSMLVALWSTDGTRAGTERIKLLKAQHPSGAPGSWEGAVIGQEGGVFLGMVTSGDLAFFLDVERGALWRTDGTRSGTIRLVTADVADLMGMPTGCGP